MAGLGQDDRLRHMSNEQPNQPGTFRAPSFDDNLGADVTSPGTMSLGVGQKVFGHFTLKRLLGQGAMGMVWLAHNGNLNREVALKFLPQVLAGDNIVLDELRRETLRCLDLSHHHIVRVYGLELGEAGTGAGGKLAAIHMEFVDGLTLRELMHKRVKEEGRPPVFEVREIAGWVDQLCDALHYAHTKAKVAHRDLKPSNIMVNSAGEAKLADFGVARKIVDNLAQVTNLIVGTGTTAYMSPQQMNGGVPHPTDDVYSLGATIFELLTSKPPFFSGDMRHQVTQVQAPTIAERREQLGFTGLEEIPEVWERVIAQCLSKNADDRPQSCEEVAKLLKGEKVTAAAFSFDKKGPATQRPARPPAKGAPQPEPAPKGFPLMPMAAAVVVLIALIGGGIWWKGQQGKGSQPPPGPATPGPQVPTAPTPAAPAMPQFGTINITSDPPGAEVIFDGKMRFRTPSVRTNVPTGPHTLLVSLPNHEDEVREFALTNTGPLDIKLVLKRLAGQVSIDSTPDKSAFVLKGTGADNFELRGQTPFKTNLAIGAYTVTLSRPNYEDKTERVTVEAGGSVQVNYTFPMGGLDLRSTPPGLAFEVFRGTNRVFAGNTPTNFTEVPAGSYRVTMKRDGFAPFDDTVAVLKSLLTPINWNSADNVLRGAFSITTFPTNASAIIEGQAPRYTPALFASLTPGKYNVTFRLDGYEQETREIEVKGGATNAVPPLTLKRSTGTVQLASTPPNLPFEIRPVSVAGETVAPKRGSTKSAAEAHALPTGIYEVRVQRPGWPEFVKEVNLTRGQSLPLSPEFPEGTLDVTTQPATAKIEIDGKPVSKFPLPLPPGPHEITASFGTAPSLVTNVALAKGQSLKLPLIFPGSLAITVEPPGAEIFVAGLSRGKAAPTLEIVGLPPGDLTVEAKLDGHVSKTNSVTVKAGERATSKLALAKVVVPKPAPAPAPKPPEPVVVTKAPTPTPTPTPPPPKPVQEAKVVMPAPAPKPGGIPGAGTKQFKNSLGMEFVVVPGVKGLLCVHETRVADFQSFAKEKDLAWAPETDQTGEHPAVNVSWQDARDYCAWLTEKERKAGTIGPNQTYRLPADLEWSAAVGLPAETGKTPTERSTAAPKDKAPWGDTKDAPPPKGAGNYGPGTASDDFARTSPVRSFKPNQFGLFDLGGNAWEWCDDQIGAGSGVFASHVLRGGSWKIEIVKNLRPSNFMLLSGMRFPGSTASDDTGFRLVLDLGQ